MVVGLVLAVLGGFALRTCASRGWVAGTWLQIPIIALALFCFGLAQWLGGSGFIASFVGGLTFRSLNKAAQRAISGCGRRHRRRRRTGDLVYFRDGHPWFADARTQLASVAVCVLSLTVVRMLPVFLCLIGKGLQRDTLLFMGWFGPRGLASIVFVVMVIAEKLPGNDTIVAVVSWTIVLSIVLHGLSANPLASMYGARADARGGEI